LKTVFCPMEEREGSRKKKKKKKSGFPALHARTRALWLRLWRGAQERTMASRKCATGDQAPGAKRTGDRQPIKTWYESDGVAPASEHENRVVVSGPRGGGQDAVKLTA